MKVSELVEALKDVSQDIDVFVRVEVEADCRIFEYERKSVGICCCKDKKLIVMGES